MIYSKVPFAKR